MNHTVNRFLGLVVLPVLDVILEKKATRSKTVRGGHGGGWLACLRVDPEVRLSVSETLNRVIVREESLALITSIPVV